MAAGRGKIYDDITQCIGNTPLVKLRKVTEGCVASVVVNFLNAGSTPHTIGAQYNGSASYQMSTASPASTLTVTAASTTTALVPPSPTVYGQPGYAQLAAGTPPEIATGSRDGSELGVFHALRQPQRLANLPGTLAEYLRWGYEPAVVFVT